ncbi:MAG: hypothetical protein Q8M19_25455 [Reyranella sp.]|nr:hypothetical protein [Reyranella sp.]
MFIRKSFDAFLKFHSDANPVAAGRDWVIDWRWLATAEEDAASRSEHSLIDCPAWAKLRTPRRA